MQKKIVSIRETVQKTNQGLPATRAGQLYKKSGENDVKINNTSVTQCSSHYGSQDSEFVASD